VAAGTVIGHRRNRIWPGWKKETLPYIILATPKNEKIIENANVLIV